MKEHKRMLLKPCVVNCIAVAPVAPWARSGQIVCNAFSMLDRSIISNVFEMLICKHVGCLRNAWAECDTKSVALRPPTPT